MDFCGVSHPGDSVVFYVVQNLDCRQTSVVLSKGKISYVKRVRALRILCERKQDNRTTVRFIASYL